jgi:transposase
MRTRRRGSDGRRFSLECKPKHIGRFLRGVVTVAELSRELGTEPSVHRRWKPLTENGRQAVVAANEDAVPASELRTPVRRIKELERASGRKTMEVELLQAAGDGARQQIGFAPDCDEREALAYERHVGDVREHAAAPLRRPRGSPTTAAVALEQAPT